MIEDIIKQEEVVNPIKILVLGLEDKDGFNNKESFTASNLIAQR